MKGVLKLFWLTSRRSSVFGRPSEGALSSEYPEKIPFLQKALMEPSVFNSPSSALLSRSLLSLEDSRGTFV